MVARFCLAISFTAQFLTGCVNTEQLQPGTLCGQYVSSRDIDEIRVLLLSRQDIRRPLWGLTCDHGRLLAESGGRGHDHMGSFVSLVRRNGNWQIVGVEEKPVMTVVVSSILSSTTENMGQTP